MMLQRVGCDFGAVQTGSEAVATIKENGPGFDLILLDLVLPELDGLAATREIRVHEAAHGRPPVWIVALTASAMGDVRDRCAAAGMNDFLAKPIRLGDLIEVLDRIPTRRAGSGD
jgi:CheY-like chemotaxis protein